MRLATYELQGAVRLGAVVGDRIVDLAALSERDGGRQVPADMLAFIDDGAANLARARQLLAGPDAARESRPLAEVRLLAPIPRPRQNVMAIGRNYKDHVAEGARARGQAMVLPEHPVFFTKRASAVIGPEETIPWDAKLTEGLDWEAELAIVFGRRGKDIQPGQAYDYVFGYTCANDISARDLQIKRHGGQFFKGKSLDGSCPLGPWIVTPDEVPNPHDLQIASRVNGQVKQQANTSMMIFDIPTMVEELSAGLTLEPGDVFLTGTPSGVGFARTPPEFLRPGDVVEVEVQGIGVLRNRLVAAERR